MASKKTRFSKANAELKKALKWLVRSGVLSFVLLALIDLFRGWQQGEYDFKFVAIGSVGVILKGISNAIDYWQHEYRK